MADIAIGISKIEVGAVGDGIPGASLTQLTENIALGTVNFNFNEPQDNQIEAEDVDDPVDIIVTKGDPDYIEFALISPEADTLADLAGGTASDPNTTGGNTHWDKPSVIPEVNKTVKITTKTNSAGFYTEYTVVNAKVVSRISQAPGKTTEEQLLVRCYIQQAKTAAGVVNTPFIRGKVEAA